ncbi:MAG: hypothetical protein K0S38_262 [Candidatus Paceibacter sp.]|jgi:hypothetical protein|nr:hypothetical protein [Candidatus Paceibacter sp.]
MKSLKRSLASFDLHGKKMRESVKKRKLEFKRLFPHIRIAILRAIYEEADGQFPHDFDPTKLIKKVRLNGQRVSANLFWATFKHFGTREKCAERDGSFNIEHHYCSGKVPLRLVASPRYW